ncbi:centrosomal protein 15 isoform X2 [Salarias fasciatus]|uniref:Uncharacterized protein n=1 Tax=Salarias fasciatus TaxID=181472 RepID=A0A672IWV7_SALFA|nr:uncharacterized protein C3orf14 homolog isoform X2 [Salarias fasciatus]
MSEFSAEETDLMERHEHILSRRAELLQRMEAGQEPLTGHRKQQEKEAEAARHRNTLLLQDLQQLEDRLRGRQLPAPSLLAMETRYWASVEESVPSWEHFLLGKGPHPADGHGPCPARRGSAAKDRGLPPLPTHRPAR